MDDSIRVVVEVGKKKRVVASAFDWPGWDRSANSEEDALRVLAAYRLRYAKVAALAGLADEFGATGELAVVQRVEGNGMTDYYGVSGRAAEREQEQRKGPRGGGRERDEIVSHVNGAEIDEYGKNVGVRTPLEARHDPKALSGHREALCAGIREFNS